MRAGLILLLALAGCATGGAPADVRAFIEARDACDHFRGEEAYDAERGRFLDEQMERYCVGSDARLRALRARYAHRADVLEALAGYEAEIEAPIEPGPTPPR